MDIHAIENDIAEVITSCGCTLYDIALVKENATQILRISIMKDGGVSLDDCQLVSESISPLLDVKDVLRDSYTLEVSSPGIERVLKTPRHFMLSLGEIVHIRFMDKSECSAKLINADESGIWLDCSELDSSLESIATDGFIPYHAIKRAKTIFMW